MFLSPVYFWLLIFIPPLIFFHLRKRQRSEIIVSSLFLWTGLSGKVQTKFRKIFNSNIHLILQIIIIILLSAALSDPVIFLGNSPKEKTVIIIDGSASMSVIENEVSRFELAKSEAVSIIRERRGEASAVILSGSKNELISDFGETSENQIKKIKDLELSHTVSDINSAVLMGYNLIDDYKNSEIILISDGAFNSDIPPGNTDSSFSFIPIGSKHTNLGITAIKSRRDPELPDVHHLYINIQNFSDDEAESNLIILVNGNEYKSTLLNIPGNGSVSTVQIISEVSGRVEVVLDSIDLYPLDNRAFLILETENTGNILLVSDGNFYLESLLSITAGIDLYVTNEQTDNLDYDIIIFDKPPSGTLDPGNYIFFGAVPADYNIEYEGAVKFPGIKSWDSSHPVLNSVDPSTFTVYEALQTKAGREFSSILDGEVPLIYTSEKAEYKSVYFTFMLNASDLVLKTAFPLLLNNSIKWLLPEIESDALKSEQTGKLIRQRNLSSNPDTNSQTGTLIKPDGEKINLAVRNNACLFTPDQRGFYTLKVFGKEFDYGVNIISPEESDIGRRFTVSEIYKGNANYEKENIYPLRYTLLYLIIGIMIFELTLTRKKGEGAGRTGKLQLGLAFISLILLIMVLGNISILKEKTESTVVFLLDISRSISHRNREAAINWITASLPDVEKNFNTAMVLFGEDAEIVKSPGPEQFDFNSLIISESEESNLESGLNQALALLPRNGANRIVILTDGNETKGDIVSAVKNMGNEKIKISTVPLSGISHGNEIIAHSIIGPSRVSPEEYISLTFEIESQENSSGNIYFYMDGEYYGEDLIDIYSGRTMLSYKVNIKKSGYHLFEAVIESENDIIFENNRYQKMIFVEGSPPILYVHNGAGPSDLFAGPLKDHGFSFDIISASTFPDTLNDLFSYDSVILDNIPAYYFSTTKMEMIRKAVSGGLGLFVIGGDNSLGAGGYYNTPLEKALPVDVDITSSLDLPGTAIVMLIDNSGSMQDIVSKDKRKSDLAKQAVYSALKVLDPGDTAGILAFNADFEWIVKIEPELNLNSVRENLFPLKPGGGTVLLPALKEAYRVLNSTSASVKHILILSDGYADSDGFESLLESIRNSGITVSTVAVGSDSNQKLMENIAAWGRGRNYYTDDIRSVPSIFVSESLKASKQLFVEETFFPSVNQPHEILSNITESEIPPLHGFMLTYPKVNSEILLTGIGNNPLLSVWQYGLGRSAVFTSNLSSSWASDWYVWDSNNLLFAHILRWISRGDPSKGIELSLSHNRSKIFIDVDARSGDGGYLNGLNLSGMVIFPDFSEVNVEILQDAAGSYKGEFPVSIDGNYFVTVKDNNPIISKGIENLNAAFISVPYPEEYRNIRPSRDILHSIRTLTNGEELSLANTLSPDFYKVEQGSSTFNTEYWQLFLLLGFALFLVSVFFRLQKPETVIAPLIKLTVFFRNLLTGRPYISYNQFRENMETVRSKQKESKHNNSFWFGKDQKPEDTDKIYISRKTL